MSEVGRQGSKYESGKGKKERKKGRNEGRKKKEWKQGEEMNIQE